MPFLSSKNSLETKKRSETMNYEYRDLKDIIREEEESEERQKAKRKNRDNKRKG